MKQLSLMRKIVIIMKRSNGLKRVLAILIDGLLCAFILFVLVTIICIILEMVHQSRLEEVSAWEYCWMGSCEEVDPSIILIKRIIFIFQLGIPFIFIISPVVAHGLVLSIFKNSIGSKIMGITVKNSDGSNPLRSKFLKQMLFGLIFSLSFGIASIISGIKCLYSKQTLTDKGLDLQAFDRR